MKSQKFHLTNFLLMFFCVFINAQTVVTKEEVSGVWSKSGSPYIVLRDLVVPVDSVLTIEPGVEIRFASRLGLQVEGAIVALGSKEERIRFTSTNSQEVQQDSTLGWKGILIDKTDTVCNVLQNCIVEYVYCGENAEIKGAIHIEGRKSIVKGCTLRYNKGYLYAAMFCDGNADVSVVNNTICHNASRSSFYGGGVAIFKSKALVAGNTIFKNRYGMRIVARYSETDTVQIINNTIVNNGTTYGFPAGLDLHSTCVVVKNNIFWNNYGNSQYGLPAGTINQFGIEKCDYVAFENCIIEHGTQGLFTQKSNLYLHNNGGGDPHFADIKGDNFLLTDSSSCVNSGGDLPAEQLAELSQDISGKPRVHSGVVDIGANEFQTQTVNRKPEILTPGDRHLFPSSTLDVAFNFHDGDVGDTHVISVVSRNPNLQVLMPGTSANGAVYSLSPVANWQGETDVVLSVTDASGKVDVDSFSVVISDTVSYDVVGNTRWDRDTIYVTRSIGVRHDAVLEVAAGTCVKFIGESAIIVDGIISVMGSPDEAVVFTSADTTGYVQRTHVGWRGIELRNRGKISSFNHCVFEYVNSAVAIKGYEGSEIEVTNCIFRNNVTPNSYSNPAVIFANNASVYVGNTLFIDNHCYYSPVFLRACESKLLNNVFFGNRSRYTGGVKLREGKGVIKNSIFWNNTPPAESVNTYSRGDFEVSHSVIEFGKAGIHNTSDTFFMDSILETYPLFVDTLNRNFHLTQNSVGINMGAKDAGLLKLKGKDFDGNARVYQGDSNVPDIGIFEYQGAALNRAPDVTGVEDKVILVGGQLEMSVDFIDPDLGNNHIITVVTDNDEVEVENLSGNFSGATYSLRAEGDFVGETRVVVKVEDNFGAVDSVAYLLTVKDAFCGDVVQDVVWDQDTVDISCDVTVKRGVTLTIAPGTVVRFCGSYQLKVEGTLEALGTVNDSIGFMLHDSIAYSADNFSNGWQGIYFYHSSRKDTSKMEHCVFSKSGSSAVFSYYSNVKIANCHFYNNNSGIYGGSAIRLYGIGFASVEESYIHHNSNERDASGISCQTGVTAWIKNNVISSNSGKRAAGVYAMSPNVVIEDNLFENNFTTYSSGAIHAIDGVIARRNIFRNNSSEGNGGAIYAQGAVELVNNRFEYNRSGNTVNQKGRGGAVYLSSGKNRLSNNLFVGNSAFEGGAICAVSCEALLGNNTICKDTASQQGSAIYIHGANVELFNSIVYGNHIDSSKIHQIYLYDNSTLQVANSLIEGGRDSIGVYNYSLVSYVKGFSENIDVAPCFTDFENNDFSLSDRSFCINNGSIDTTGWMLPEKDLMGHQRVFEGEVCRIDMGAFEFAGEPQNRGPIVGVVEDVHLFVGESKEMVLRYVNSDAGDAVSVSIESMDNNLMVENISGTISGATYDLVPANGWQGTAQIKIIVEDGFGLKDSCSYGVNVNNNVCGILTENTIWESDTVFVLCSVTIPEGVNLTVAPGTVVEIDGNCGINVFGSITAVGTVEDSITFVSRDTISTNPTNYWRGFYFPVKEGVVMDTSKLGYCNVCYSDGSSIKNDAVVIDNCFFSHNSSSNGGAIRIEYASPLIQNSTFCYNDAYYTGGAITYLPDDDAFRKKSPRIISNVFFNNNATYGGAFYGRDAEIFIGSNIFHHNTASYGGALFFDDCRSFSIENNLIYKNRASSHGGAIKLDHSSGTHLNNTIVGNSSPKGGALYLNAYAVPSFYNSIIVDNVGSLTNDQVFLNNTSSQPSMRNCNVQGGLGCFMGSGSGIEYSGVFDRNIDTSPYFVDAENNDFHLTDSSACINTGTFNIMYQGAVSERDLDGNCRLFAGEMLDVDMGVYEFQGEPVNREPMLSEMDDQYVFANQSRKVRIDFVDVDIDDRHTLSAYSNNHNVSVGGMSGSTSGSFFRLVPVQDWEGAAEITVRVEDQGGKVDSTTFTFIVSDHICGSIEEDTYWDRDTVRIVCDVTIEPDVTLEIAPGTQIIFDRRARLNVLGNLVAVGDADNRIVFTAADTTGFSAGNFDGWNGIRFFESGSRDTSRLIYCDVSYSVAPQSHNLSDSHGGAVFIDYGRGVEVSNCVIRCNEAYLYGGGVYCADSPIRITNNLFCNNRARLGGGLFLFRNFLYSEQLSNNVVVNNSAVYGGGVYCNDILLAGNTIVNNQASSSGGGIYCKDGVLNVLNTILWGNRANHSNQLFLSSHEQVNFFNSVLEGGANQIGTNGTSPVVDYIDMVEEDPVFVDPTARCGLVQGARNADWNLQAVSPCIDGGDTIYAEQAFQYPEKDASGRGRIQMNQIDMGALEFTNQQPVKVHGMADQTILAGRETIIRFPDSCYVDGNIGDVVSLTPINPEIAMWTNHSASTKEFICHPQLEDVGVYQIVLKASDLFNAEAQPDTFMLTVEDPGEVSAIGGLTEDKIRVFPVPAMDVLNVELNSHGIVDDLHLELYNLKGQTLDVPKTQQLHTLQLDISELSRGVYLLKVTNPSGFKTFRVEKL